MREKLTDDYKEACRLFWLVKGHLNSSDDTILGSYNSYFRRLWCKYQGEDMSVWEEGFEEEYQKRLDKK